MIVRMSASVCLMSEVQSSQSEVWFYIFLYMQDSTTSVTQ